MISLRVVVRAGSLADAVNRVGSCVCGRSTLQILGNVLLEAEPETEKLLVSAYDLEVGAESSMDCVVVEGGDCTVPFKLLRDVLKGVGKDTEIEVYSTDRHEVYVGMAKLNGLPGEEFPRFPELGEGTIVVRVPASRFIDWMTRVGAAASKDDPRKVLQGVLFIGSDTSPDLTAVAIDGYRLAVESFGLPYEASDSDYERLVPNVAIERAIKLVKSVGKKSLPGTSVLMEFGETQVRFYVLANTGCVGFVQTRHIEGVYPNWDRVIPSTHTRTMTFDRDAMLTALKVLAPIASDDGNKIGLYATGGSIRMMAKSQVAGLAKQVVTELSGTDDGLPICINQRYFKQMLEGMPTGVVLVEYKEQDNPFVFKMDGLPGYMHLIMPMGMGDWDAYLQDDEGW